MHAGARYPFEPTHHGFSIRREKLEDRCAKLGDAFVLDFTRDDEILQRALAVETAIARPQPYLPKAYHVCGDLLHSRVLYSRSCRVLARASSTKAKVKHSFLRLRHIM